MLDWIVDGNVVVLATDLALNHSDEKMVVFDQAPFGIVFIQTAVPIVFDRLVHSGKITVRRMIELLSTNPARLLKLPGGTLAEGAPADVTILLPDQKVTIRAQALKSKSKNTPFDGWEFRGGVLATIVAGRVVHRAG